MFLPPPDNIRTHVISPGHTGEEGEKRLVPNPPPERQKDQQIQEIKERDQEEEEKDEEKKGQTGTE